jgi:hypothetical protein
MKSASSTKPPPPLANNTATATGPGDGINAAAVSTTLCHVTKGEQGWGLSLQQYALACGYLRVTGMTGSNPAFNTSELRYFELENIPTD